MYRVHNHSNGDSTKGTWTLKWKPGLHMGYAGQNKRPRGADIGVY